VALRELFGSLLGVTVGVLGLAFKPHTDDVREAPAITLVNLLAEEGALVRAYDPRAIAMAKRVINPSVTLTDSLRECADGCQALVLVTEWPEIVNADWEELFRCTAPPRFLFDGRNALDPWRMRRLRFLYRGIGRSAIMTRDVSGSIPGLASVDTDSALSSGPRHAANPSHGTG